MKPPIHDAPARQHSGGPPPVPARGGSRTKQARKPGPSEVEAEIAGLLDRSTQELRLAWRQWHRTGSPLGLSRDLLIRALAYELQERAHGGPSVALRRARNNTAARSTRPGWTPRASVSDARSLRSHPDFLGEG